MAATMSRTPSWLSMRAAKCLGLRVHTIANLGAYPSTFWSMVPTWLYAPLLSGPVQSSRDLRRGRRGLHQHRRLSTPFAAQAARRRPSWSSASSKKRRERPDTIRRSFGERTSSPRSRIRPRSSFAYDIGDYAKALDKALELADYKGVRRAQGGVRRQGQAAWRGIFRLYRGMRPCALPDSGRDRRRRRAMGIRRGAGEYDRHRGSSDRVA